MIRVAYSPIYKYALPEGHRFPMDKYTLLPEQLLYEGTLTETHFFAPRLLSEEILLRTHERTYWEALQNQNLSRKETRRIGFPMTPKLVERGRYIASGTLECVDHACAQGVALNIAGGTHHAFPGHGEGFCVLNDIAIAATECLYQNCFERILVIDLDVHHGNGTAYIFRDEPRVFTFSMHGAKNYPVRKPPSDWDIPLPDGTQDEAYLQTLKNALPQLFESVQPQLVFYLSGVDVLSVDKLGRLAMSKAGCRERDRQVLSHCQQQHVPVVVSMGGGYAHRIADIVDAHANTYRVAKELFE